MTGYPATSSFYKTVIIMAGYSAVAGWQVIQPCLVKPATPLYNRLHNYKRSDTYIRHKTGVGAR